MRLPGRRGDAGDEADDRLLHVVLAPARGVGLVRAADLADHDHGVGVGVVVEGLHHVDVLEAVDRVAADADRPTTGQADLRQLRDRLVGQRAGAADDADASLAMDVARHDADLDLVGVISPGQFGPSSSVFLPPAASLAFIRLRTSSMSRTGCPR
jgi:hypothetical protein